MTPDTKVFVSYAHPDRALAEELFRRLRPLAVDVWSDDELRAGENWQEALRSRLRASQYFVLLLTPRTFESSWVLQELGAAFALGKQIIPVVTDVTDRRLVARLPVAVAEAQALTFDEMDKLEEVLAA